MTETNTTLDALKSAVLKDGKVDAAEVTQLRDLVLADGNVDRAEADTLFEINDAVSGKDNDAGWTPFFVEAITKHVLSDPNSPGAIDDAEAEYLKSQIHADGHVDVTERALLGELKNRVQGTSIPTALTFLFNQYL